MNDSAEQQSSHHASHQSVKQLRWSVQDFYEKSWALVKKHRALWLFGLASLALGGSGGANFNTFSFNSDSKKEAPAIERREEPSSTPQGSSSVVPSKLVAVLNAMTVSGNGVVLGEKTQLTPETDLQEEGSEENENAQLMAFIEVIKTQWFQVPTGVRVLFFAEMLGFFGFSVVIGLVGSSWAQAALYKAFQEFDQKGKSDVTRISTLAVAYVKPMMKYTALSALVVLGTFAGLIGLLIVAGVLAAILSFISEGLSMVVVVLGSVVAFFVLLYYLFKIVIALSWGRMFLLLENTGAKRALDLGWSLVKVKYTKRRTFELFLANAIVSFLVMIVGVVPFVVLLVIPVVAMVFAQRFLIWSIPFIVAAMLFGAPFYIFVMSLLQSVVAGTWYFGFEVMKSVLKQSRMKEAV